MLKQTEFAQKLIQLGGAIIFVGVTLAIFNHSLQNGVSQFILLL